MAYKHKPPKRRYPAGTIGTVYFKTIVGGRRLEGDRLIIDAYDDNFYYVRVVNEIEETYSIA